MSTIELPDLIKALTALSEVKAGPPPGLVTPIYKHSTPTGTPSTPYYTGPGGLFGVGESLQRDVFSTRVVPQGLISRLPWRGSVDVNPLYPYLTGFQTTTGSNKTTVCSDPKTAGAGKNALLTAQFGRYEFMTREMELNRVGQRINRGEMFDLRLVNDPLGGQLGQALFPNLDVQGSVLAGREMLARMLEVGIAFQNQLVQQVWTGNPANNSAGGGYEEFPGLEILIGTNKVDAKTGADVASLDSLVRNANYAKVDATTFDVVNVLTYMYRYLKDTAQRMNLNPVKWVIAMRNAAWWEITNVWPCSYLTYKCAFRTTDGTVIQNVNAADQIAMRDAMRAGKYLLIDGDQVEVVIDDGIVEENSGNTNLITTTCFASDIYIIPVTVAGGLVVSFMEYFDYTQGTIQAARDGHYMDDFWSDNGIYLWHKKPPLNWCVQLIAKIEPRLIFLAPFLAAKLTNLQYCPLIHERDPFVGDGYFVNGGVSTSRAAPSYWSDWRLP